MSTEINIKKKLAILNEGASVTTDASSIDFVGSGVNTSTVGNDVTVTIPGGSGNTTYYMNATVPETPYAQFSSVATTAVEQVLPWTVDPGDTETAFVFQTPSGVPNTTQIPGGLWQFFLHFNSLGVNENWIIRPTVYKRDLGGTETLLFTADPQIINNLPTVTTMYVCDGVFPATTLLTTDRLVVKIALQNTGVSTQTLNFRTEGSQHYSVAFTTLNQVIAGGSVTSVTGTAPIVSSGGTTPAISIPLATGSANGYLSSSDWSVFSAKLGGSGTINRLSKWISSTALGNSLFEDDGTSIAIGTNPSASIKLDVYSTLVQSIRGINGSTSVGNKTAIEGTANGANGTNIGGYFYAQNATNNYSIWLQDGTQGVGKVLTSMTSDGKAQWATPSGVSGSGTTNYLPKFTPNGTTLGNSLLQDNGTSMSVNTAPNSTYGFYYNYASGQASIFGQNTFTGAGDSAGVVGSGGGTVTGTNLGGSFLAFNNATLNIGVKGSANSPTAGANIGGYFLVANGTNNYAVQLQDGTQGIGKVLTCITADGKANWVTPSSAGSGVCGIANSSGVYTYYATLTLAMTAAVSGDTIELFADITETGSVAITLKSGVKINGNGHTYTLSVNDNTHALICSVTVELFNWKVVRTGRANGSGGYVLYCAGGTLRANAVIMQNTYGVAVVDGVAIYGLNAIGYYSGFALQYEAPRHYDCIGESTGLGNGIESPYTVNCTGVAVSGIGITGNGTHLNSTGISTSGSGLSGQTFTGCIGISTSGTGVDASAQGRNCIGISTSGVGGTGIFYESTLISSSNYGCQATIYNSYIHSVSSVATNSSSIYNSTVRCLWNNAAGHCTSTNALGPKEILNSFLEVTNASAYCITGYAGSTWKYSNNSFKGATTAVNATNITQGITNTSDNQGNILI